MSTALQRLLARPSSLAFLRYLVREPGLEHALERASKEPCIHTHRLRNRSHGTSAANVPTKEFSISEAVVDDANDDKSQLLKSTDDLPQFGSVTPPKPPSDHLLPPILNSDGSPVPWGLYLQNYNEVQFQSDLRPQSENSRKLVDDPRFGKDLRLWTYLLEFRKRHDGSAGVATIWAAIRKRGLLLPTEGSIADKLWPIFLLAGFQDKQMLHDICRYADEQFDSSGEHWSKFYVYIMQHMILKENHHTIVPWHERLIKRHPPGPNFFSKLVRNVILMEGDLKALKLLYKTKFYETHDLYKTYGKIIPILLKRQDFNSAMQWHLFLVRRGDHPRNTKIVEPLIQHFEMYDPWKAMRIKTSLISAGLPVASASDDIEEPETISREMMNVVHGKAFGIEPKKYSDRMGARWFATNWISLDLAINSIHALGVQGIGPLSLQAIALREADASGIVRRIDQLKELGISIGEFVFSKAVESFARNNDIEYLNGLLKSDQHPESYENRQLQEDLLAAYARAGDWAQYRLTAAIQVQGSHSSPLNRYNIMQRANIFRGDRSAFFKMLEEMRVQRVPFTPKTILQIMQHFLPHRRRGNPPNSRRKYLDDLQTTISILKTIMEFGSSIPPTTWREIIRRLGMLRRFDDVEKLCLWLAPWYNYKCSLRSRTAMILSPITVGQNHDLPSNQITTSHMFHPLRRLFSGALQGAIVEWAFKHGPLQQPFQPTVVLDRQVTVDKLPGQPAYHYTRGIKLLRQLQDMGVYIDIAHLRSALRTRFAILYIPGESNVLRNRLLKRRNSFSPEDMVAQLNKAWGADIWLGTRGLNLKLNHARSR